jgi:hypothetical protein
MSFQLVRVDILIVFIVSFGTLLVSAFMLKGTKLRPIPTVEASFEAVRVATEKGTPLLFDTGWTGANFWGHSSGLTTLAFVPSTLELLKQISKEAAPLGVRLITGTTNAVYAMMSLRTSTSIPTTPASLCPTWRRSTGTTSGLP